MNHVPIVGWIKNTLIDYPDGGISTAIFLPGCNLRCPYCHNPDLVNGMMPTIPFTTILDYLKRRKGLVTGAVVTGGEPTIHDDIVTLFQDLRDLGLKVKLDTNGLDPITVIRCKPDYLALDIKTSFDRYTEAVHWRGECYPSHFQDLTQSIEIVKRMGNKAEVRITCAPDVVIDSDIPEFIDRLRGVRKVYLQQFHNKNKTLNITHNQIEPYPEDMLFEWQERFNEAGINCHIRW